MPRLDESRLALIDALLGHYGPLPNPGGGPIGLTADDPGPFEAIARVAVGLVADPRVADAALIALRDAELLQPGALAEASPLELDDLFQQARIKLTAKALRPLQKLAGWATRHEVNDDQDWLDSTSTEALREAWRGLNGVGPATADAWLLFGLGRPTYPVDRATYRVLLRHGWVDSSSEYDEARSVAEGLAPDQAETLARLSLAFERLGRDFCKPSSPRCDRCPLRSFLPDHGPIEAE